MIALDGTNRKYFKKPFKFYFTSAFQLMVARVRTLVQNWCPDRLNLSFLSLSICSSGLTETTRDEAVRIFLPFVQQCFIVMS